MRMSEIIDQAKSRFKRISAVILKEIRSLLNDRVAIAVLFLIPITLVLILGLSQPNLELYRTRIWIIDYDESDKSNEFITTMNSSRLATGLGRDIPANIYVSGQMAPIQPEIGENERYGVVSEELANEMIATSYLDAYIIIHSGFETAIANNGKANISIYLDAIDYTNMLVSDLTILLGLTEVQLQNLIFESDVYAFPEFRPATQGISILTAAAPYFIPLMLFFTMQLISTQSIVGDVPLKRLLNTSLMRGEVIVGKVISYMIFGIFQILISILMLNIFSIPINCLWSNLFIILLLNSTCGICMGVFISCISKTRLMASQIFLLFFFVIYITQNFVRNIFLLMLNPLEQSRIAYEALVFRGLDLKDPVVFSSLINMSLTSLVYFVLSVVYIKYFKREFV